MPCDVTGDEKTKRNSYHVAVSFFVRFARLFVVFARSLEKLFGISADAVYVVCGFGKRDHQTKNPKPFHVCTVRHINKKIDHIVHIYVRLQHHLKRFEAFLFGLGGWDGEDGVMMMEEAGRAGRGWRRCG